MKKKILFYFLTITFLFSLKIISQEKRKIGIHQEHKEQFAIKEKALSKFNLLGKDIVPLNKSKVKSLSKIIFGFLPDWEYENGAHNNMQYEFLTHIAAFDFAVSATGTISNPVLS